MKVNKDKIKGTGVGQQLEQQQQIDNSMQPGLTQNPNMNTVRKPKSKLGLIVGVCILIFFVVISIMVIRIRNTNQGNQKEPVIQTEVSTTPEVTIEPEITTEPKTTTDVETTVEPGLENVTETVEPTPTSDGEVQDTSYDYDNKMLGIQFNYSDELYIQENTEEMFNALKKVAGDDGNFDLESDKLTDLVNLMKFTTGTNDTLYITVSLVPFTLTSTVKASDNTVKVATQIDEKMLKTYDQQIKDTLVAKDCKIDVLEPSVTRDVNGRTVIISERKYSGGAETSTGVVDVIQGLVPIGANAILVTAITDGSPTEIDKVALFDELIDSLNIVKSEVSEGTNDKE